jgi:CRISPR-associated endonuclease Csn1
MNTKLVAAGTRADLQLAFDVGHSSIGWAVLQSVGRASSRAETPSINLLGCGVVTFGADDCLASERRKKRGQRRHLRATRKRIELLAKFLIHLLKDQSDASTRDFINRLKPYVEHSAATRQLQGDGDSFAWQKAAEILAAARTEKPLPKIEWPELWNILRWYAHNRGYFAPPWANREDDSATETDDVPDTEKVENANAIMRQFKAETMAETLAAYSAWYEIEAAKWNQKERTDKPTHFKGLKAAFQRESVVWPEVHALLIALKGKLPKLDDAFIRALMGNDPDPMKDREAWQAVPCPSIKLPCRYQGGLLFGQVIPRFENRIIGVCPIQFARRQSELLAAGFSAVDAKKQAAKESKLPSKNTPEFLRYRWAMQLANIFGACIGERETRPLTADERKQITERAERQGAFTRGAFIKAVREIAGWPEKPPRDNLDGMLMTPDAEKALVLDPAQREIHNSKLTTALAAMPDRFRKRLRGKLRHGQTVSLKQVRGWLDGKDGEDFDAAVQSLIEAANTKRTKKQTPPTADELLAEKLSAEFPKGRAPYARPVLRQAYDEVMQGYDPRAEKSKVQSRGSLCQTNELKEAQLQRRMEEQTNNHLIRHRLLILGGEQLKPNATPEQQKRRFKGLLHDLIQEFANGDRSRIARMTIEVNRDLRDLSGKTREKQQKDLGLRLGDFKRVSKDVEDYCKPRGIKVTAGLIRKARIANDQGWKCPYTKETFELQNILNGDMELDHIIPYRDRESNSLDSLVVTWKEINAMKKRRTAWQFISEEQTKPVDGMPRMQLLPLSKFEEHVKSLKPKRGQGHPDDRARKERRVKRLLTPTYEEKEFTPRDLTVTSHLVRLGAQVLQRAFPQDARPPVISLPGSVTGEVRKAWRLIGCLEAANPAVIEEVEERNLDTGKLEKVRRPKKKDDIRGITHLHHALDACVLGLASYYFPRHGTAWSAMVKAGIDREADDDRRLWLAMTKRRPSTEEATLLKATGLYEPDSEGRWHLSQLPEELRKQLRQRLAEKRVVQHIPAEMSGMPTKETVWRIFDATDPQPNAKRIGKWLTVAGISIPKPDEDTALIIRRKRRTSADTGDSGGKVFHEGKEWRWSYDEVEKSKMLGYGKESSKLRALKGGKLLDDNFGIALYPEAPKGQPKFIGIRFFKVWKTINALPLDSNGKRPRILRRGQLITFKQGRFANKVWRVLGLEENGKVRFFAPDNVRRIDKPENYERVMITSLLRDEIQIVKKTLTGIASVFTTSSK